MQCDLFADKIFLVCSNTELIGKIATFGSKSRTKYGEFRLQVAHVVLAESRIS
jgi:hypothetical protein